MTSRQWFDLGAAWASLCETSEQLRERNSPALAQLADRLSRDVYQLAGRIDASDAENYRRPCVICGRTGQAHYTGEAADCSRYRSGT